MNPLRNKRVWLGVLISLICLWFALRNVPLAELEHLAMTANLTWLLLAIACQLLAIAARAQRWVILLDLKKMWGDSFWAQGVGYLFTNVFPLRLGEPARVWIMAERSQLPLLQIGASAIVERLLDVATIVLVLTLILPWMQVPIMITQAGISLGALTLAALILSLLAVRFYHHTERLLIFICRQISFLNAATVIARWQELANGLEPLTRWHIAVPVIGWSLTTWALSIAMYWCVLRSFQSDGAVIEATFMLVALALAVTVPSSPGFVGIFQWVGQQALVWPFGTKYSLATALAITLTVHLIYYLITTTVGIVGLWRCGQSFAGLGRILRGRALIGGKQIPTS